MLLPVPAAVPPHEPVNHSAIAPVPALPPEIVSVVLPPAQIVVVPVIPVGAVESGLTVTLPNMSFETQLVVVFLSVKVNEMELPEAPVLKVALMGLVRSPSVTPVMPVPEMEYLLGDCVGLV